MSKNTIKTIIMVVAIILALSLAGGWIAQTVVRNKEQKQVEQEIETADAAFTVTPQNTSDIMLLSAETYADTSSNAVYSYTITANTQYYDGDINWTTAWTGSAVYWNKSEETTTIANCVKLTVKDNRSVTVQCLQPFGRQIKITATLADNTSVSDYCICNYKQGFTLSELQIGFNTFEADGSLGKGLIVTNGIVPASVSMNSAQTLSYSCELASTSYTVENTAVNSYPSVSFTLTPNYENIAHFGLEGFNFMEYTGNFNNSLTGELSNFFDVGWLQYAVNGTSYSAQRFASILVAAQNSQKFGVDSEPIYTLTLYGLGEERSYDYYVDLYSLGSAVQSLSSITLDNHDITFGG